MRINKFIAQATGLSRRKADELIGSGRVDVNGRAPSMGHDVQPNDTVQLDGKTLQAKQQFTTIMLNKPRGYVCSRDGQGSQTIYDLLPPEFLHLKPVGRLDKESSGLLLLTDDGQLAYELTHPKFNKDKLYTVNLDKPLPGPDQLRLISGVQLEDGLSKLQLVGNGKAWQVTLHEGRNRQIRRTFEALGYQVIHLHRTEFGEYRLGDLKPGKLNKI